MKNLILVTGGLGYIGSHCVVELIESNYNVVILDNLSNSNEECLKRLNTLTKRDIPFYNVDLKNESKVNEIFIDILKKLGPIMNVIHFAAYKAVGESVSQPLKYYENNIGGSINLLKVMEQHKIKRFIFSSSCTVYGEPERLPFDETHSTGRGCTNPYGKSKYFVEEILKDIMTAYDNWHIVILRYFNPVGAHASGTIGEDPKGIPNNLMPFVTQVAAGKREFVNIFGSDYDTPDGTGVRDYIHIVDLAKGHVAAVRKLNENCKLKIYNLGTGNGYSVKEVIQAMSKACGHEIPFKMVERREGDLPCVYGSSILAEIEMGWKTEKNLEDMCNDAWRWQISNPNGFS